MNGPGGPASEAGTIEADVVHQAAEIARPADGHRRRAERILENQVPADDPREDLADRRVGVGVGAAGDRHHRGELGVAEAGERAAGRRQDHRQHERRSRVLRRRRPRQHEDARADDRPDAERGQVPRPERSPQQPAVGFRLEFPNRFFVNSPMICHKLTSASLECGWSLASVRLVTIRVLDDRSVVGWT